MNTFYLKLSMVIFHLEHDVTFFLSLYLNFPVKESAFILYNPFTFMSYGDRISPYNNNTKSNRQEMRLKFKWIKTLLPIPIFPHWHHDSCMVESKEIYWWDLGVNGLQGSVFVKGKMSLCKSIFHLFPKNAVF